MAASTPSKRSATDSSSHPPAKKHWSQGLLASMNDPNLIVESDERIVIIKDKYPKALHHFLAIPKENIPNLKALKREQSELLRYLQDKCRRLASRKYPHIEFRYGYHAIPSMSQLHLHMISQDFDSPCLKTKRHWNSFNTKYFLDSEDVIRCLEERGMVVTMTPVAGEKLLDLPLKCHKCTYSPQHMPKLKQHLYKHINN